MNNKQNKILCLLITVIILAVSLFSFPSVQAATNDFTMKKFDKAYITFVFDDGRMPFSKQCFEIFENFKMPMGCSLIANNVRNDKKALDTFKEIEAAGGEIFSHTLNHIAIHKDNSDLSVIEAQLGDSYRVLTALGFNVNGIIETGNGGDEATANYELIETVARKYYKYSNAYGVSSQYKKERIWLRWNTLDSMKSIVDRAINNKEWLVISAHDFSEFSKENMIEFLEYINEKGENKIEVVTWNYVYKTFGKYTGPAVPTKAAIESVCEKHGHDLKNTTIKTEATCEKNATEEGKCKRCGKTATQEIIGTASHKFGKYEEYEEATCLQPASLIAKCTVKGCEGTHIKFDEKNGYSEHDYQPVEVKKATSKTSGLAENRCTYCGKLKGTIIIPKGKTIYDVMKYEDDTSEETESQDGEVVSDPENQPQNDGSKPSNDGSKPANDDSKPDKDDTKPADEPFEKEETKEESNTIVVESDFENDKKESMVATILIIVVAVVCLALWGGIGYFIYRNIIKKRKEE